VCTMDPNNRHRAPPRQKVNLNNPPVSRESLEKNENYIGVNVRDFGAPESRHEDKKPLWTWKGLRGAVKGS